MRDDRPAPPTDRRSEPGLQFDPATGQLALGTSTVAVPVGADNLAVLDAYVELAALSRGDRVAELFDVRQADVDALAAALDLDAADLALQIQEVLGASRAEAIRLVSRLRESRLIGGITKAATGAVLAGSLLAGASTVTAAVPPATETHQATAATTASTTSTTSTPAEPVIDGPLTEDESGVGLIPPVTEEASGVVLIPPATQDRDDPAGS